MEIMDTVLPEVKVVMLQRIGDARGFVSEVWNARDFASTGIEASFVQDNHVRNPVATENYIRADAYASDGLLSSLG
jgi:dTDP-4-dehydrorhamnose 3,5-epimerase-like enzyme